jgi:hypothetical protein
MCRLEEKIAAVLLYSLYSFHLACLIFSMKIYVTAVQALRINERQDETQFTTEIGGKN